MLFDKHFSLPTGYRFLLKDVIKYIEEIDMVFGKNGEHILDIGCGKKPYKKFFHKYNYIGMDFYTDVSNPDIYGSINDMPQKDASVDACMTVWVLDDLKEPENGIKEISRVLRTGGLYFAIECQSTNQHFLPNDYFRFAPGALIYLCEKYNLSLVSYKSYGGDFALIGFSIIATLRKILVKLKLEPVIGGLCYFFINIIFRIIDKFSRSSLFNKCFESNSLGYFYIFKKE